MYVTYQKSLTFYPQVRSETHTGMGTLKAGGGGIQVRRLMANKKFKCISQYIYGHPLECEWECGREITFFAAFSLFPTTFWAFTIAYFTNTSCLFSTFIQLFPKICVCSVSTPPTTTQTKIVNV